MDGFFTHEDPGMVVVKIKGGLGNQLFQYAAGLQLASARGVELKLDLSFYEQDKTANHVAFALGQFNIDSQIALPDELSCFESENPNGLLGRFLRQLVFCFRTVSRGHIFLEKHFHYDPQIINVPKKILLDGYWQSEKYFYDISDKIREKFEPKIKFSNKDIEVAEDINKKNSVSVHIRRGDYVSNKLANEYHGVCNIDYYLRAFDYIHRQIQCPSFFVFSDDIPWVKQNLGFLKNTIFVDHNDERRAVHDLYLMSLCRHHIIANSTFSWWGAWLGEFPDKIVVAPRKWFSKPEINTSDLLPASWVTL